MNGGTNLTGFVFELVPTVEYGFATDFLETVFVCSCDEIMD